MTTISILIASAVLAASQPVVPANQETNTATLKFVSENRILLGTAYGLDAIDARPRGFGQRLSADLTAGQRTVWYSCPNSPQVGGGSRITFNFESGHSYELVCQAGKEAVIRQTDEC